MSHVTFIDVQRALVLCLFAACGRIAFEPLGGDANGLTGDQCVADTFDDGDIAGWTSVEPAWMEQVGVGPDGSPALVTTNTGNMYRTIAHVALTNLTAVTVAADIWISNATSGDFIIELIPTGWATPQDLHYQVGIFPPGSDTGPDNIAIRPGGAGLASGTSLVAARVWHRISVSFDAEHAIEVKVDGTPHMMSPPDATIAGPLDVLFSFFGQGRIDNVTADCVR